MVLTHLPPILIGFIVSVIGFTQAADAANEVGMVLCMLLVPTLVLAIRTLLYEEGFTIKGARKQLGDRRANGLDQIEIPFTKGERRQAITRIRRELESLLHELA